MDRLTRKELKADHFVEEVGHTVEYVTEHRQQLYRYGAIAAGVIVVVIGIWLWMSSSRTSRQEALREALHLQDATVGQAPATPGGQFYPTQAAKDDAVRKAMQDVAAKYGSSDEGTIAKYYLGVVAADGGNLAEAEKQWKDVAENGAKTYASQAKFSLAQLYASQGKRAEAEKLYRWLIDNPTELVSKEQAIIALARFKGKENVQEARKLLEPLQAEKRVAVSRAAITALSELR